MQYIRQIIEALPPCEGADVDALTEKLSELIESEIIAEEQMKLARERMEPPQAATPLKRQCERISTALTKMDNELEKLDPFTRDFIWSGIHAEVDGFGRYVSPDEIRALLAPLRKRIEEVGVTGVPEGRRTNYMIHIFTSNLIRVYEEAVGHPVTKNDKTAIEFIERAFESAEVDASAEHYIEAYLKPPSDDDLKIYLPK